MMDQNSLVSQIFLMLFFGVFQVLGAAFIGLGVRQLLQGQPEGIGQIFAGGMFAGVGTLFSVVFMHEINPWSIRAGIAIVFIVVLGVTFATDELLQRFGAIATVIGIGSVGAIMGGIVLLETMRMQQEIVFGLLFGGCWGFVGLGFLLTGLGALLRGKPLRFRQKGAGTYEIVLDETDEEPDPSRRKKKTHRD